VVLSTNSDNVKGKGYAEAFDKPPQSGISRSPRVIAVPAVAPSAAASLSSTTLIPRLSLVQGRGGRQSRRGRHENLEFPGPRNQNLGYRAASHLCAAHEEVALQTPGFSATVRTGDLQPLW